MRRRESRASGSATSSASSRKPTGSAQELRGKADAEATAIYAEAYGRDPEFYAFVKSLETYERTVDASTTFFVLGHRQRPPEVSARAEVGPAGWPA